MYHLVVEYFVDKENDEFIDDAVVIFDKSFRSFDSAVRFFVDFNSCWLDRFYRFCCVTITNDMKL